MADALDFQVNFSQLVEEMLKVNNALGDFDLKAESVINVSTRVNQATGLLQHALSAFGPDGEKVVVVFDQIEKAGAKLANIGGPITGALDVVAQAIKRVSETQPVTGKSLAIGALTSLATDSANILGGSSGTLTQSNAFTNQIAILQQAAERAKAPLDDLLNLVGKSQGELANTTGATREFANALFNLNQIAAQTKTGDFADQVATKFAAVSPGGISAQQQSALTNAARQVGDAAAKAGLDTNGLDSILNQSSDALARNSGEYFKVAQAILNYRGEINKLTLSQVAATDAADKQAAAQNATANTKQVFFGTGDLTGTTDEITKASTALSAFQREAEKSGLSEKELGRITEDFRNGVVSSDAALSGLNKALLQVQSTQRGLGATQVTAIQLNDQLLQKQQQLVVAASAISQIRLDFPIPPNAASDSVNAYAASLTKLQSQIATSKLSAAEVREVFLASVNGTGQVFEGEAGKIQSSINGVVTAYQTVRDTSINLSQNVIDFLSRVSSQVVTILINRLYQSLNAAVQESLIFNRTITQSAALVSDAGNHYDLFSEKVLNLSNQFGIAREELASGLVIALKQHVGDTADALTLLSKASEFSRVTNSSLVDSVTLLTTALNSYGLNVKDADQAQAILFEGIRNGRLSVSDLKESIGNLGAIAQPLGVGLGETVAALDALTKAGVNAANSQTFLRNFMKALITPTKELQDVLDSYGLANGKAAEETLGLAGVLKLLSQTANGNVTETGKLTSNLRAIQATLGLTGDKMQVFIKNLEAMDNGQKDFATASAITFKSSSQIIAEFTESAGNSLKRVGSFLTDAAAGGISFFSDNIKSLQAVLISFSVAVFVANIGNLISAVASAGPVIAAFAATVSASTIALLTNPLVLAGLAIGALVFAAVSASNAAAEEMKRQEAQIQSLKDQIVKDQQAISDSIKKTIEEQNKLVNLGVANIQKAYHQTSEVIKDEFEATSTLLKNLFDEDVKHRNEAINQLKSSITKAQNEIGTLQKEKETDVLTIQDRIFEEKLKTLTLASQIEARDQQAQDLISLAIADNEKARESAASNQIDDAVRFQQISKREFDDASKQLDKVAAATLKVRDLSKGYTTSLIDFTRADLDLQVKVINESEKDMLDSFKRIKDAVKDIRDKTGDFSGDSTKFLQGVTKQLTTYLNSLRGANGRVRIDTRNSVDVDPQLGRLLDALDPKTIKKLRFAIETHNQEDVNRILQDVEIVQKKLDEISKARAAYNEEQVILDNATAARHGNNFEDERKFLQDALTLSVKSQAEGFRSGNQVQQDLLGIRNRLLQTYVDEATVKGEVKQRDDVIFQNIVKQADVAGKQLALMRQQVATQDALQVSLKASADSLEEERQKRELEVASVRALFQEIDKLKPGKDGIVTDDTLNKADELVAKLANGSKQFNFFDPNLLTQEISKAEEKASELHKLARAQRTKSDLEEARVALEGEGKLRVDAENTINKEITRQRQNLVQSVTGDLPSLQAQAERLQNIINNNTGDTNVPKEALQLDIDALAKINGEITKTKETIALSNSGLLNLTNLVAKLESGKPLTTIDAATLKDVIPANDEAEKIFNASQQNTLQRFAELSKVAENFGLVLSKPFELTVRNEQALGAIETIRQSINNLKTDFNVEFKVIQGNATPPVNKFHGGVVYGPNGIDAVPAMLTAGETVIDAQNSSRFFGQLMQIRAGQAPSGSSNSVNFGGVSINVSGSNSPQANARAIVAEIQKLKSRGLVEI